MKNNRPSEGPSSSCVEPEPAQKHNPRCTNILTKRGRQRFTRLDKIAYVPGAEERDLCLIYIRLKEDLQLVLSKTHYPLVFHKMDYILYL